MDRLLYDRYVRSHNRLFLLDYDGTLVNFSQKPDKALPGAELRTLLGSLSKDQNNKVVIISGRDRKFLDSVLGDLPISLVAEHGYFTKDPGSRWVVAHEAELGWKKPVRQLMRSAAAGQPGVSIEEKVSGLVWHYDGAGRESEKVALELEKQIQPQEKDFRLKAVRGRKILEVRVAGVDKGIAASRWLSQQGWEFILAAGDDTTDEDLFAALPDEAISIKVGPGKTLAKYRLPGPSALNEELSSLLSS